MVQVASNTKPSQSIAQNPNVGNSQTGQSQQNKNKGFSFHTTSLINPVASTRMGGEILRNLSVKFRQNLDDFQKRTPGFTVSMFTIDCNQDTAIDLSAIAFTLRNNANKEKVTALYTYMIEGSNNTRSIPTSITKNIGNENIECHIFPTDIYEGTFLSYIKQHASRLNPDSVVAISGGSLIPASLEKRISSKDDFTQSEVLMANALTACQTKLQSLDPDAPELDLSLFSNDSTIFAKPIFSNQDTLDIMGNPCRNSVNIELTSRRAKNMQNNNYVPNNGHQDIAISSVRGFIDLLYMPSDPYGQFGQFNNGQMMPASMNQKYAARFVITHLENYFISTIPGILLALSTASLLGTDNNYYAAFQRTVGYGDDDFHDVGALNIEVNMANEPNGIGTRINTSRDVFSPADLGRFLSSVIRQNSFIYSIDVPDCSSSTWYLQQFVLAAENDLKARQMVFDAAQILTGGNFAKYFSINDQMFNSNVERIHMGTYTDSRGETRDIRNVDYLYVLNSLGEKDPNAIKLWSDSFIPTTAIPHEKRMLARYKMIQNILPNSVITGMASRVTITMKFREALSKAIYDCNFTVCPDLKGINNDIHSQRANAMEIYQNAFGGSGGGEMFRRFGGVSQPTNGFNTGSGFHGRVDFNNI